MIIFACAFLGLLFKGPAGFVIGGITGAVLSWVLKAGLRQGLQQTQSQFLDSTFAVLGAISKADGVVSPEEIRATEQIFDMLRLSPEQRERAKAQFSRGKAPDFDLDAEVDLFNKSIRIGRGHLMRLFLQLQCMAVSADGRVDEAEHAMLVRIARRIGLTERDVAQLEALLRAGTAGASGRGGVPPQARLDDAYTALGLAPGAEVSDIKKSYRRLMSENHPDKLAARGLPESMRQVAEERSREINVAYELIKDSRGFT